jgi:predicted nucleotide-binding protein
MKKGKIYNDTKFKPGVISEAFGELKKHFPKDYIGKSPTNENISSILNVEIGDTEWGHENDDEFFSDYINPQASYVHYSKRFGACSLDISVFDRKTTVRVNAPERRDIESVFGVFEKHLPESKLPPVKKKKNLPKIFIGHGNSEQWKELKDHLHEKQNYDVEAYEVGSRAGHEIRDVLQSMLDKSSFAILVMTGENKGAKGKFYARDNVVHELGLFQGRLGFNKTVVLLEKGTEEFSNIKGVHQIRYSKGKIKETFGDILATLKREFKED